MDAYVHDQMHEGDSGKIASHEWELEQEYQQWLQSHPAPEASNIAGADPEPALKDSRRVCPVDVGSEAAVRAHQTLNSKLPTENCQLENRVQNRVSAKTGNPPDTLSVNISRENGNEKFAENKNKNQGVAPVPQNRRERRLQEKKLKSNANHNKRK